MEYNQRQIEQWVRQHLVCPRDHQKLEWASDGRIVCARGHEYPLIDGVPIMLISDKSSTQEHIKGLTLSRAAGYKAAGGQEPVPENSDSIDFYVKDVIGATCGAMYNSLIGKLAKYPIPKFPLRTQQDKFLLDIGCNWGRWAIGAAMAGYSPVGIDHNLDAIFAARRVSGQFNLAVYYLVADARYLPFDSNIFDVVFSYSVLQHFSEEDLKLCLAESSRVMKSGGIGMFQMPNRFGLRNIFQQLKRVFKKRRSEFDVTYWDMRRLKNIFSRYLGKTVFIVDGFFSLNPQPSCVDILPRRYRLLIGLSESLKKISKKIKCIVVFADSLYVKSVKSE